MEKRLDILNELETLSPLIAGMKKVNVFTVPAGYFESLTGDIMASLKEEDSSFINSLASMGSFRVPEGYFDSFADNVMARIKAGENETAADELRQLSPMLYSIQNENVFEVPAGYFASLSGMILNKVAPAPAKLVSMTGRKSFMKYAIAAAFTGIMLLGVVKYTGNTPGDSTQAIPDYTTMATVNVDAELSKLPDEEIIKYLEASGSDVNAALVANSVDENVLPTQEDYLTDDKALDKYLNSINVNDVQN